MFPGGESIRLQASADNHMDRRGIREYLLCFCCYVLIIRYVFLTITFFSMARFLWHINGDGSRTYIVKTSKTPFGRLTNGRKGTE